MLGRGARDPKSDGSARRQGETHRPGQERRVAAWIGASVVITGDLASFEDTTIAGRVDGDVSVREHTLIVAPGAHIEGNVIARAVTVHGQVKGTLRAEQSVEIGEAGSVVGDIIAPRMKVSEGAVLNGRLQIAAGTDRVP